MKLTLSIWSCHKYILDGQWTNAEFINFAATTPAEAVELLYHPKFWEDGRDVPAVKAALERTGLKLACIGATNNFAKPTAEEREQQLEHVKRSVDLAAEFGANLVRVFSGDRTEGIEDEQAKAWITEGLKQAAAYAESKGVVLCLENHGYFFGKGRQVADLIETVGSPALRSTFDMGNFLLVDDRPEEAYEILAPYVRHVHAKDFLSADPEKDGPGYRSLSGAFYIGKAIGEGEVPLDHLLGKLKAADYDGWLTVEFEANEEQKSGSQRSLQNLREHLAKLA
ncbi:sugar phosphate isomerase/epimerase family protein [Paenibacillus thermoaerophilus]|uniref:Sugar phosphate isomerase/epimerase family protein n=1 Tax=Paenibacillus thermoaerophilus TaxID=1215385 RepID=A0ABW2UZ54_9BACL|nr:sugar phosphate isomerase/epimerase [Paenibacillus thermoaerophilus]TMV15889.1 sugar phosphate isomerase/epimerase [Paenibacillus thermoaerophilus]